MIKKTLTALMLFVGANSFSMQKPNPALEMLNNDNVQSFIAGAASSVIRPALVDYFKSQPVRAGSITSMIVLAHGLNVFRSKENRMKRLILTCLGASITSFILNK